MWNPAPGARSRPWRRTPRRRASSRSGYRSTRSWEGARSGGAVQATARRVRFGGRRVEGPKKDRECSVLPGTSGTGCTSAGCCRTAQRQPTPRGTARYLRSLLSSAAPVRGALTCSDGDPVVLIRRRRRTATPNRAAARSRRWTARFSFRPVRNQPRRRQSQHPDDSARQRRGGRNVGRCPHGFALERRLSAHEPLCGECCPGLPGSKVPEESGFRGGPRPLGFVGGGRVFPAWKVASSAASPSRAHPPGPRIQRSLSWGCMKVSVASSSGMLEWVSLLCCPRSVPRQGCGLRMSMERNIAREKRGGKGGGRGFARDPRR